MNIFRKRISLILSVVMLALSILPIFIVNAADSGKPQITVSATYDGKEIKNLSTIIVEPGSPIKIAAAPSSEVDSVLYKWGKNGEWRQFTGRTEATINVPNENGETKYLYVSASRKDGTRDNIDVNGYVIVIKAAGVPQVSFEAKLDSKVMKQDYVYEVEGGEKITVKAKSTTKGIAFIAYLIGTTDVNNMKTVDGDTAVITVPTGKPGTTKKLYIEAVGDNDNVNGIDPVNTETKTPWIGYTLKYVDKTTDPVDPVDPTDPIKLVLNVSHDGNKLSENSTTEVNPGESVRISAEPEDSVKKLYYKWDDDAWSVAANTGSTTVRIPTYFKPGETHWLYVKATYDDGKGNEVTTSEQKYKFVIPETASDITMNVKIDSKTVLNGKTYEVEGGEDVVITASSSESKVDYIRYYFGSDKAKKVDGKKATFNVPDKKAGTTLKLYAEAFDEDGATTGIQVFTLKFVENNDGKLDVEPWMEENDEITELSINLRNDSEEEEKANKNIYALEETVTYYIDYMNGSDKDITSAVKIEFEIPIEYEIINKAGGELDEDEDLLTWTFEDGLEEGASGTIVVKLKYTGFTKSKYDNEKIYPSAAIFKGKKEADRSTVINLIIEDYDTEIDEEHEPYMYGDLNTNTFRPDDTITRAEGALVLARIYGLNYERETVTTAFADIGDTYLEAQKAITAATKAGLINGYTNGNYRPNAKMTKAEFMKILACMVEASAEDEDIEGLEIKDLDNMIKVYADDTRYYIVDGKKIYSHWALEEVSLLARLNMTALSEDEDEIELDEEITRAEVAQLVNFYLLRAPANITSKTKTGFDDVSKKHDLVGDIIEATREAHTFSMDEEDGTEIAE